MSTESVSLCALWNVNDDHENDVDQRDDVGDCPSGKYNSGTINGC